MKSMGQREFDESNYTQMEKDSSESPTGISFRLSIVSNLAADDRHHRLNILDLIGRNRQVVPIKDQHVRQFARLDRAQVVFLEYQVSVLARVRYQCILTADGLPQDFRTANHFAGDSPPQRRERQDLIGTASIAAKTPRDSAVLDGAQRRHVVCTVFKNPMI